MSMRFLGRLGRVFRRRMRQMSTTTGFFRNEAQMELILKLLPDARSAYVFGASAGCEAYTLALHFIRGVPGTRLSIAAFDIDDACLARAREAVYTAKEVDYYQSGKRLDDRWRPYFISEASGGYRIRPDVQQMCAFRHGSVLDGALISSLPSADLVLCQNVLIHMSPPDDAQAMRNLAALVKDGGILALGGMSPARRAVLTRQYPLEPITEQCEAIHEGWRDQRGAYRRHSFWRRPYTALEPFRRVRDWPHRYSSLFRKRPS